MNASAFSRMPAGPRNELSPPPPPRTRTVLGIRLRKNAPVTARNNRNFFWGGAAAKTGVERRRRQRMVPVKARKVGRCC